MNWKTTWSYVPINYDTTIGTIENITQHTRFWNNLGGDKIKIRFSNLYSKEELVLEKVTMGIYNEDTNEVRNRTTITYQGQETIRIAAGEEFDSDAADLTVKPGESLVLSVYVKQLSKIQCACSTWFADSFTSLYEEGKDYTQSTVMTGQKSEEVYPFVKADALKACLVIGVSNISVFTCEKVKTVIMFGDSITHMSYYTDALMKRLYQNYPGKIAVINRGIGGNRVLNDATVVPDIPGHGNCFGTAGVTRFAADVYQEEDVDCVCILEGINDCMHPYFFGQPDQIVTASQLELGLTDMMQIAKEKNSKVILGTVMPFRDENQIWLPEAEKTRIALNEWIRSQKIADEVVDFDAVMRMDEDGQFLKEDCHIGDGLHPNVKGGTLMAEAIYDRILDEVKLA